MTKTGKLLLTHSQVSFCDFSTSKVKKKCVIWRIKKLTNFLPLTTREAISLATVHIIEVGTLEDYLQFSIVGCISTVKPSHAG
jgi:hypothetical protein